MSDTVAAIRAAREVQAETLAPELYRSATEWFFKAKKEYRLKNFSLAREHLAKARKSAEDAEFEAIRSGAVRSERSYQDPVSEVPPPPPPPEEPSTFRGKEEYPTPTGTPVESYEERAQQEAAKNAPPSSPKLNIPQTP